MKSSASKIKLESYGNLFGKGELPTLQRVVDDTEQVVEIPLAKLVTFANHPFKVIEDEKMDELVESIKTNGVLVPGIVRKINDNTYELISGHRRKYACELAGKETMPVFVKDLSDEESTVIMVDANIQRETILPSEKARAYSMKYEALKHQGKKGDGNTLNVVGEGTGDSAKTVQRYIQLSRLIDGLLDMVDANQIGFMQGIELAYLSEEEQKWIAELIEQYTIRMNLEQAKKLKELSKSGELTKDMAQMILWNIGMPIKKKVTIKENIVKKYFPDYYSLEEIEETIISLLEEWKNTQ